jgi:queuosine precursor transporter
MYLGAIITANLIITKFGPAASIITAFFCIGLDLTARDYLHEVWHNNHLKLKMGALIATGSILSWLVNSDAGRIAIASFIAFALAGAADTIVYSRLFNRLRIIKINGSNVGSALVDSIAFPTLAFGVFMPLIILGQFAAKVGGGFLWSLVIVKLNLHKDTANAPA